jgi:hypothetical protein
MSRAKTIENPQSPYERLPYSKSGQGCAHPMTSASNVQRQLWLQWNAATECNIMLPLVAFPMHYYPAPRCNPILPSNLKRSRLPNPTVRGDMTTPVGANRK